MLAFDVNGYPKLIRKAIARKKNRLQKNFLAKGRILAIKNAEPFIDKLKEAFIELEKAKVECILKTAEDLVEKRLQEQPKAIVEIALKLLHNIAKHTDVEITAHKTDGDILRESLTEISLASGSARKLSIVNDNSFPRGSLLIKADKSVVDGHRQTKLNKAKEILISGLTGQKNGSVN